jgi:uncharacterized protein (TIGR00255 family)
MTGFGQAIFKDDNYIIQVQIKSLNSRYFEFKSRLPANLTYKEMEIKKHMENIIQRGKTDLFVHIKNINPEEQKRNLNKELVLSYYQDIKQIRDAIGDSSENLLETILLFPDVFSGQESLLNEDPKEWNLLQKTLDTALSEFDDFRIREGNALGKEISIQLKKIQEALEEIDLVKDKRIMKIKSNLEELLKNHQKDMIDNERLEQELIYYAEKFDITEEIDRLRIHISSFFDTMCEESPGRKLGFITQELGREINTIGSKANNSIILQKVVLMKNELEKIKQQLANLL